MGFKERVWTSYPQTDMLHEKKWWDQDNQTTCYEKPQAGWYSQHVQGKAS